MNYPGKKVRFFIIGLVGLVIVLIGAFAPSQKQQMKQSIPFPGSCTTFFAKIGNTSLFGNNEDYNNPKTLIWVVPSSGSNYGGVYFGYNLGRPQGGINEKGLAFDGLAIPPYSMNDHPELPDVSKYSTKLWKTIMAKSANINEAIDIAMQYNWANPTPHQVLFADREGNAAVIGPGVDGEISVTRKPAGDGFLVSTNFNLADPEITESCSRYETATEKLSKIQKEDDLTVKEFQKILDSVHMEGDSNNTLYSNIFDLNTGRIYLYYWHQFNEPVILNVDDELANAPPVRHIRELFSEKTVKNAETEFHRYRGEIPLVEEYFLLGWYIFAGLLFLFFIWDVFSMKAPRTHMNLYWVLTLIISGPFGFAGYLFSYRKPYNTHNKNLSHWQQALGAAAIIATGYGACFLAISLFFHFFFPQGSSGISTLLVPFLISLILFRTPLLTILTKEKYFFLVLRAVLTELISTIFALSSIIFIDSVLKTAYPKTATPDNLMFFGMISAFTLASFIVIFPFHLWLSQKGCILWFEGVNSEGEFGKIESGIKILNFKEGWGFLFISIALLVLAVILS